jgi:lipid IVA palmitoyltransferase
MMKKLFATLCLLIALPASAMDCSNMWDWATAACQRVDKINREGKNDLLVSGYSWHQRSTYEAEKLESFNEFAYGGGIGKRIEFENGDQEFIYGMIMADSHEDPQLQVGYMRLWYWPVVGKLSVGAGMSLSLISRQDVIGGIPFPAPLPFLAVRYGKASVMGTFIPRLNGQLNNGNVAYFFGRYEFD